MLVFAFMSVRDGHPTGQGNFANQNAAKNKQTHAVPVCLRTVLKTVGSELKRTKGKSPLGIFTAQIHSFTCNLT